MKIKKKIYWINLVEDFSSKNVETVFADPEIRKLAAERETSHWRRGAVNRISGITLHPRAIPDDEK